MIKNIILDCDGVLYPLSELSLKEYVGAMKYVYRNNVGLTPEEQKFVSEKTLAEGHLGMFNYIREICRYKNYDFNTFCQQVTDITDYSNIKENRPLWQTLQSLKNNYNISILTNNSRAHLNVVFSRIFNKNAEQVEKSGIKVYDIRSMEKDGYFYPKQHELGFARFLKNNNLIAKETVLFDDTPVNIEKARESGMSAVLISREKPLLKELQKYNTPNTKTINVYE